MSIQFVCIYYLGTMGIKMGIQPLYNKNIFFKGNISPKHSIMLDHLKASKLQSRCNNGRGQQGADGAAV